MRWRQARAHRRSAPRVRASFATTRAARNSGTSRRTIVYRRLLLVARLLLMRIAGEPEERYFSREGYYAARPSPGVLIDVASEKTIRRAPAIRYCSDGILSASFSGRIARHGIRVARWREVASMKERNIGGIVEEKERHGRFIRERA